MGANNGDGASGQSSILNFSVGIPHTILNLIEQLTCEDVLAYGIVITYKAGFDLEKLVAGEISAATMGGVATDAQGYFAGPGGAAIAYAMGNKDARTANVCINRLRGAKVLATRPAQGKGRLHDGPDICLLELDGKVQHNEHGRSILADGGQAGVSPIPLKLIFDMRLRRYRYAIRLYGLLIKHASGPDGAAFPTSQTLARELGCSEGLVRATSAALVQAGYYAELQRGLHESNVRIFPPTEDVGNPAWSEMLSSCNYYDLLRARVIKVGQSGKMSVVRLTYEYLLSLTRNGVLRPREINLAKQEAKRAQAREAQQASVEQRLRNAATRATQMTQPSTRAVTSSLQNNSGQEIHFSGLSGQPSVSRSLQNNSGQEIHQNSSPLLGEQQVSGQGAQNVSGQDIHQDSGHAQGQQQSSGQEAQSNSGLGVQGSGQELPNISGQQQPKNSGHTSDLQKNSGQEVQRNSDRVDSESGKDKDSGPESGRIDDEAVAAPTTAHEIVSQLLTEYGDNSKNAHQQLDDHWQRAVGRLTEAHFIQIVSKAAQETKAKPAGKIKKSRMACFNAIIGGELGRALCPPPPPRNAPTGYTAAVPAAVAAPPEAKVTRPVASPLPADEQRGHECGIGQGSQTPATHPTPAVAAAWPQIADELRPDVGAIGIWDWVRDRAAIGHGYKAHSWLRQCRLVAIGTAEDRDEQVIAVVISPPDPEGYGVTCHAEAERMLAARLGKSCELHLTDRL